MGTLFLDYRFSKAKHMGSYIQKVTLATTLTFLSLVSIATPQANGSTLSIGKYAFLKNKDICDGRG